MDRRILLLCPGVLVSLALYLTLGTGGEPFPLPNLSPSDEPPITAPVHESGEPPAHIRIIAEARREAHSAKKSPGLDEALPKAASSGSLRAIGLHGHRAPR